jgi:hypothetical protein
MSETTEQKKKKSNEGKELAQCLAFAYFAENPNYNDKKHEEGFLYLFSEEKALTKNHFPMKYKKYLSSRDNFPYELLQKEFAVTKTATGKASFHPTSKKVYNVAKACIKSRMFKSPLNQYRFLDQKDEFVKFIKDETLTKVKKAFGFGNMKVDMFSSVDVFIVKTSEKRKVVSEFTRHFHKDEDILRNELWGKSGSNDYASVIGKFMKDGTLIPLSLKLPNAVTAIPHVKLISLDKTINPNAEIDPFIKLLTAILDKPNETKKIINTVIHIDFDKFSVYEKLNWEFPVDFNYTKLIDPATDQPIESYNLRFNLFAQGHGAGWNGQFDKSTKMHKETQWVGGASIPAFERIARDYSQYKTAETKMLRLRLKVFEDYCKELEKLNPNAYNEVKADQEKAQMVIEKDNILYGGGTKPHVMLKPVESFFDAYDELAGTKESFKEFQIKFITKVRGSYHPYDGNKKGQIDAHFAHAQISYFMTEGGKSFQLYFKQKMFLTIYGLITKMAHKVYDLDDYKGMKNAITKIVKHKAGKQIIQEFRTAPHYIVS